MIKQRRDSIEQFTNGNRLDLASKEAAEIVIIEEFLPKALDEAGLATLVAKRSPSSKPRSDTSPTRRRWARR